MSHVPAAGSPLQSRTRIGALRCQRELHFRSAWKSTQSARHGKLPRSSRRDPHASQPCSDRGRGGSARSSVQRSRTARAHLPPCQTSSRRGAQSAGVTSSTTYSSQDGVWCCIAHTSRYLRVITSVGTSAKSNASTVVPPIARPASRQPTQVVSDPNVSRR